MILDIWRIDNCTKIVSLVIYSLSYEHVTGHMLMEEVKWADACLCAPYTRVPLGEQHGSPTCIDACYTNFGTEKQIDIHWHDLQSDHALLLASR